MSHLAIESEFAEIHLTVQSGVQQAWIL